MRLTAFGSVPRIGRMAGVWLAALMLVLEPGTSAASQGFQYGACTHLALGRSDTGTVSRLLQDLGMNSLRDDIYWGPIERRAGQFALPGRLADVREAFAASKRLGGTPLAVLGVGNSLYDQGGLIVSDAGIAAYDRYVRFVLREYGDSVGQYEVWNEWNSGFAARPTGAHGDAAQYAKLLKRVYTTIKSTRAEASVVGGAVAGVDIKWIDAFIDAGGLDALDALSIHSYTLFRAFDAPEGAIASLARVHRRLVAARPNRRIPILITEMGWPTSNGKHGRSEETVAAYLTRFVLMARSQEWIEGIWWYDLIDDGDSPAVAEHRFGLTRRNGEPKPAYDAARALAPVVIHGTNFALYRFGVAGVAVRFEFRGRSGLAAWRVEMPAALWPDTMPVAAAAPAAVVEATRDLAADGIPRFWVMQSGKWRPTPELAGRASVIPGPTRQSAAS